MKATLSRRIIAVLLTLAMALTLIPSAFASSFTDVPDGSWFTDAVEYCFEEELMKGTGEGKFDPTGKVTREMVVQTLYAMYGSPEVEYEAKFTDVPEGAWYTPAIMWGASNGIVNGYDTGAFGVGDPVTREQVAMFFYNFASYVEMPEDFASLNRFPDNKDTSDWAKTSVQWAVAMGVISGKGQDDGTTLLKPKDPLTRAELASILYRFNPQAEEYIEKSQASCHHDETELRDAVEASCLVDGYTGDLYCLNPDCELPDGLIEKGKTIPALGHIDADGDEYCDRCGWYLGEDKTFTLTDSIANGMEIVIYSPGHGMAISDETDNNWYLVPVEITPEDDKIISPDESLVWTVIDNGDGTVSFQCGDYMIGAWLSGTYIELTNDPNYSDASLDTKWIVTYKDGLFYIQSSSLSNSYGPAYIECFYNANKDKTNISGYTSSNPSAKSNDFGFQIYAFDPTPAHTCNFVKGATVAPTCLEEGYTTYTCSICGKSEKRDIVPALGHIDENSDFVCDRCGEPIAPPVNGDYKLLTDNALVDGMQIVIYNPGHGMAISNENDNNWYLVPVAITPDGDTIIDPDAALVWTVVDNGDGTVSFKCGDNMIGAWLSGTYIELTNDADYAGVDTKWIVTFQDGLFYLQSSTLSNSYGPAYIECFYNANKDKTNISGYTSGDPTAKSSDFGFEIYAKGDAHEHNWVKGTTVAPTCTEAGYTIYTCSECNATKKADTVAALGHIDEDEDGICDRCGDPMGGDFVLTDSIKDGDQVVIYNPGHGMAITNANDNNWYLVPEAITPVDNTIADPADYLVWTVVDNKDGTFTFVNGDNAIVAWLSGTYIELTNDAAYAGADGNWIVSWTNGLAYIQSSTLSNSYGPAYIECYYNANKDKTNISGYTSGDPTAKSNDFGFQFYVLGGDAPCAHEWKETGNVAATCTEAGSITYTCSLCGKTKTEAVAALGHDFDEDGVCTVCGYEKPDIAGDYVLTDSIKDGDQVVIYNPGHGMAISNANDNNWYLVPVAITPEDDAISDPAENLVWTVVDNGDGTFSFTCGDNAIVAWLSGTYIELTNDANYAGADGKWIVSFSGDYAYIQSSTLSNSYGPAYIECYYNANKDKTNISGYTSGDPTAKPDDFGFQFYAIGGTVCEHDWVQTDVEEATCTEAGYIIYNCALCGKGKTETIEALGHDFGDDNVCDVCGYTKPSGDGFVKVTDASDLGNGLYLIVYETDSIAMNGGLEKVDAAHNNISVVIKDGVIAADDATMAAAFEIKAMDGGYSIQAMGGSFISGDSTKNTIKEGTSAVANTITIDDAGNAVIFAGGYLMFNKTSGDNNYRFRYYKAQTQQPIQLYKLAG